MSMSISKVVSQSFEGYQFSLDGRIIEPDEVFHGHGILPIIFDYAMRIIQQEPSDEYFMQKMGTTTGKSLNEARINAMRGGDKILALASCMYSAYEIFELNGEGGTIIQLDPILQHFQKRNLAERGQFRSNKSVGKRSV